MAWNFPLTRTDRHGSPVLLRTAQEADAASLLLHVEACDRESTFLTRIPGEFIVSLDEERRLVRRYEEADNALFLIAEEHGRLIGTLTYTGWRLHRMRHTGRFGMSVRKSHWNRGVGGLLLDALIAWARQNGVTRKIGLEVQYANERAIALYRSRGFIEEGRLRREMRIDGAWIDLVLMGLWLDEPPTDVDA